MVDPEPDRYCRWIRGEICSIGWASSANSEAIAAVCTVSISPRPGASVMEGAPVTGWGMVFICAIAEEAASTRQATIKRFKTGSLYRLKRRRLWNGFTRQFPGIMFGVHLYQEIGVAARAGQRLVRGQRRHAHHITGRHGQTVAADDQGAVLLAR